MIDQFRVSIVRIRTDGGFGSTGLFIIESPNSFISGQQSSAKYLINVFLIQSGEIISYRWSVFKFNSECFTRSITCDDPWSNPKISHFITNLNNILPKGYFAVRTFGRKHISS